MKPTRNDAASHAPERSRAPGWKLKDAKARFSEVVRLAQSEGPQRVTVRGRGAVVVVAASDYDRMSPNKAQPDFMSFLESLAADGPDLARDRDFGRDEIS